MLPPPKNEPNTAAHPGARVWRFRLALVGVLFALVFVAIAPLAWGTATVAIGAVAVVLHRYLTPARPSRLKRFAIVSVPILLPLTIAIVGFVNSLKADERMPNFTGVRSAEIAGVSSTDRDAIDALTAVLVKAERTEPHKCGACGELVLRRSFGRTVRFGYLPGHRADRYEVIYRERYYHVPRAEFLAAVQRVGVELPLNCP